MLIMTRGPAASGKDTWARELRSQDKTVVIVNRDDLRFALYGVYFGVPIDEDHITEVETAAIRTALKRGFVVVSSNTNLSPRIANSIAHIGYSEGADVVLADHFKNVPLDELLRRNAARDRQVPEDVVAKQWANAQKNYTLPAAPATFEPYTGTPGKPRTVLCDLDGTAAMHTSGRSPYDEKRVGEDTPNAGVRHTLLGLQAQGITILYVSARTEAARDLTEAWLKDHRFPPGELLMRKSGDQRKDWIVKNEIFDEKIAPNHDVLFAIDDRDQVVYAYRKRGIQVHQVAEGAF